MSILQIKSLDSDNPSHHGFRHKFIPGGLDDWGIPQMVHEKLWKVSIRNCLLTSILMVIIYISFWSFPEMEVPRIIIHS